MIKLSSFARIMSMRFVFFLFISFLILSISTFSQEKIEEKRYFKSGEKLEFSINYGWFKLGEAVALHGERKHFLNGEDHYSVDLKAKTVGFLSFIKNVEAHFLSFMQKRNFKPTYSEKQVLEGKDKWDQTNYFNYDSMTADVSVHTNRKRPYRHWIIDLNDNTFDILGTYMYLRNVEWGEMNIGDSIMLSTLYDRKIYNFGIESGGFEKVNWQDEDYNAYKLYLLFPISKTFPEEKLVIFWVIEKDGVRLPVKIEANMRIGKVICELEDYSLPPNYN
ncbi:MAG: DUF3108 domain-containing protein [Cyclobacteriaceae bacterium]